MAGDIKREIFLMIKLISNKDFKVDYFFTFNHSISKLYSKYIKANLLKLDHIKIIKIS